MIIWAGGDSFQEARLRQPLEGPMKDDRKAGMLLLLAGLAFAVAALLADPQRLFSYVPAGLFLLLGFLRLARARGRG